MAKFLTPLIVKKVEGTKDTWELHEILVYESDIVSDLIQISKGFKTDFASVPQPFWILLPKSGEYDAAAVIHDFLYQTHLFDQKTCDLIFREAMKVLGVPLWKRFLIYNGVRIGGWYFYKKESK